MNKPLRLSPSGAPITNPGGGVFVPGSGMRLRLIEGAISIAAPLGVPAAPTQISTTLGQNSYVTFDGPSPSLNYRAKVRCDVQNLGTQAGTVQLYLDTSPDGTAWTNRATNSHLLAHNGGAGTEREMTLDLPLTSGASVGVTAGQPTLYLRARIGANNSGVATMSAVSPVKLELEECF